MDRALGSVATSRWYDRSSRPATFVSYSGSDISTASCSASLGSAAKSGSDSDHLNIWRSVFDRPTCSLLACSRTLSTKNRFASAWVITSRVASFWNAAHIVHGQETDADAVDTCTPAAGHHSIAV